MKATLRIYSTLLMLFASQFAASAEPAAYEYKVFPTKKATGFSIASPSDLQEKLDELSTDGWEVVSISPVDRGSDYGTGWFAVVGKRPRTQHPKAAMPMPPQALNPAVHTDAAR